MPGRIFEKDALYLSFYEGSAELDGRQYELLSSPTATPIVRSKATQRTWSISWQELLAMAVEAGIDDEGKPADAPEIEPLDRDNATQTEEGA